jgi:hypothetical protein
MIRKTLYAWLLRPGVYCLGRNPPDSPSMPYARFTSRRGLEQEAQRKKAQIIWCGDAARERPTPIGDLQ